MRETLYSTVIMKVVSYEVILVDLFPGFLAPLLELESLTLFMLLLVSSRKPRLSPTLTHSSPAESLGYHPLSHTRLQQKA